MTTNLLHTMPPDLKFVATEPRCGIADTPVLNSDMLPATKGSKVGRFPNSLHRQGDETQTTPSAGRSGSNRVLLEIRLYSR